MAVLTTRLFGGRGRLVVGLLSVVLVIGGAAGVVLVGANQPAPSPPAPTFSLVDDVPGALAPGPAPAVLPDTPVGAPAVDPDELARLVSTALTAKALGESVSADVFEVATGTRLLARDIADLREPASTAKLFTAAAAITRLGPRTTLATRTVLGGKDRVVLVGGGDVLLAAGAGDPDAVTGRAGLRDLAEQTAEGLRADGVTRVSVALDDGLFGREVRSPRWSRGDVDAGFVSPVQPVQIDAGRLSEDNYARRAPDPAMAAAKRFATLLADAGVRVRGTPTRVRGEVTGRQLGEVRSAPVSELVELTLDRSDNTLAEALARLVAIEADQPLTFAGAGQAVLAEVEGLGIDLAGARLSDGSGLGDGSRVPAAALTAVLAAAAGDTNPQLRPVITGLPVAAVSGTLAERFRGRAERPAAGLVRAKTGTLSGVSALAGTVVDVDGRLLAFAVLADEVPSTRAARKALDALVTTLARCGCR